MAQLLGDVLVPYHGACGKTPIAIIAGEAKQSRIFINQ